MSFKIPFGRLLLLRRRDFFNPLPATDAVHLFRNGQQAVDQQEGMTRYIKRQPSLTGQFTGIAA